MRANPVHGAARAFLGCLLAMTVVACGPVEGGEAGSDWTVPGVEIMEPWGTPAGTSEECVASCDGAVCGSDGCGGSCGLCATSKVCSAEGVCVKATAEVGSCVESACFTTCVLSDLDCLTACVSDMPPEAQEAGEDLLACAKGECSECNESGLTSGPAMFLCWTRCLREKCQDEGYAECLTGQAGCWELGGCMKACDGQPGHVCTAQCLTVASYDSQGAFLDLIDCINLECGLGSDAGCTEEVVQGGPCHSMLQNCLKN